MAGTASGGHEDRHRPAGRVAAGGVAGAGHGWPAAGVLVVLGVGSLVRQQLAPSLYNRPSVPERYRVADDLRRPLADVVAAAEQEAITAPAGQR
jgi:hypothetical protein